MPTKILIVDDDADMRLTLRGVLEPVADVVEAASGPEALRVLSREKPALMFLDVTMPGADGLLVLEWARAASPRLIVVMVTGETDLSVARRALERGARSYITKPFDPAALRAEVARLTGAPPPDSEPPWRVAS